MGLTPATLAMLIQAARNQGAPPAQPAPAGGTPQLNSALFPALFPQAPPPDQVPTMSAGGVLSPASPFPTDSGGGSTQDLLNRASQMGMQETGTQLQRSRGAGNAAMPIIQEKAGLPIPKTGWLDTQGQPPKPGAGHALARALIAILGATGPGQAVQEAQYGPNLRRYNLSVGEKAAQIEELQKQQQLEQQPLAATSGMVYHPMMAGARQESADAAMMRAKAYTDYTQKLGQRAQTLTQIAQGTLNERVRHDKVAEYLTSQGIDVQRDRNGVILTIGMGGQQLRADEFNAAVANKNQGLIEQILQGLGAKAFQGVPSPTGTTEVQPVTAGAQQPFQNPPATAPPTTPANKANRINMIRNRNKGAPGSSPDNPIRIP